VEERFLTCTRYEEVVAAIRDLTVRGAPAIGVATAMGIALGALTLPDDSPEVFQKGFESLCIAFAQARPTARNLFWAIERMKRCFLENYSVNGSSADSAKVRQALTAEARQWLRKILRSISGSDVWDRS
jgi:methylthioribose-1-phosphate isomerase